MKYILKFIIKIYKKCISPFKPPCCIYQPTCSEYALEALEIHGAVKGSFLAVKRVLRCHPFRDGGFDPVPPKITVKKQKTLNNRKVK